MVLRPARLLPPKRLSTPRSARGLSTTNRGLLPGSPAITRTGLTPAGFVQLAGRNTGQTYKGGPNTGVFLQITCDDTVEVAVPGHRYSFGVVREAEARSDLDVLAARGRRALRVHLGADVTAGLELLRAALAEAVGTPSGRE